jgi:hypothetical protein
MGCWLLFFSCEQGRKGGARKPFAEKEEEYK